MVRNYAGDDGAVTPRYLAHIERIARGGVGAIIPEATFISPEGKGFVHELGIHTDAMTDGWRMLAEAAHRHGACIGPQLYHAGRQTASAITGVPPVAPSAIPDPTINEVPHALTVEEIERLVQAYADGAVRAQAAGCDFVEVHGAHGYLITQFLSAFSNARDDAYGGTPERRFRFLGEVIERIRQAVGPEFPVLVRLSGEEQVPGGLSIEDTIAIALRLETLRVDAVHISAGNYASYARGQMIAPMAQPDGLLLPLARAVKAAVRIPVIAVGKLRTPEVAEQALADGNADFVALARPFLADPDWPMKAQAGRAEEITRCIACNQGCITRLFAQEDVWCTVNAACSREEAFAAPPGTSKRVAVIGGGPAGMAAAVTAASRGHRVTLYEGEDHLGGQLIAAEAAPHREGWRECREDLMSALDHGKVEVRLGETVEADAFGDAAPDAAIIAVGATPIRLTIPGAERAHVVVARDLLEGKAEARGRCVVAGGGCAGAQTAEYLATRGHEVTIVEMLGAIAADAPTGERELLLERLAGLGVQIIMETKIMRVEEGTVVTERPGGETRIAADTVVICLGSRPNDGIAEALRALVPLVEVVGDAVKPRKVTDAIIEGSLAALAVG
jgi:2,4-dienoyl-CoA reductase-like NADH-dependent reductase (Old Yellow Enzyme family)/thioredoxin reductase